MTTTIVKHSFYKIEIDTKDSVQPIIYFRKEGKCTTAKGMDRQHDRIVGETVEAWRQFEGQIARYTISRVPDDVVVGGEIRKA
jgi:DNA-directed RNA polymerase subunit L